MTKYKSRLDTAYLELEASAHKVAASRTNARSLCGAAEHPWRFLKGQRTSCFSLEPNSPHVNKQDGTVRYLSTADEHRSNEGTDRHFLVVDMHLRL